MKQLTEFQTRMFKIIDHVPLGKVMSYGQVATYLGIPRAARIVGGIMRTCESSGDHSWWRIINNEGFISIKGNLVETKISQKKLLEKEGIIVSDEFRVDMAIYRFLPSPDLLRQFELDDEYIDRLILKGVI